MQLLQLVRLVKVTMVELVQTMFQAQVAVALVQSVVMPLAIQPRAMVALDHQRIHRGD
jgi:hypothetical protein